MKKAYKIADSRKVLVDYLLRQLSVTNSPQRIATRPMGAFFIAHFPTFRVCRRAENVPWVVRKRPNRLTAQRILPPAIADRLFLAKIDHNADCTKSTEKTGEKTNQGFLYTLL